MGKRFISANKLAKRWGVKPEHVRQMMERNGAKPVPYASKSWRYRMVDVETVESGNLPTSLVSQLQDIVRR